MQYIEIIVCFPEEQVCTIIGRRKHDWVVILTNAQQEVIARIGDSAFIGGGADVVNTDLMNPISNIG